MRWLAVVLLVVLFVVLGGYVYVTWKLERQCVVQCRKAYFVQCDGEYCGMEATRYCLYTCTGAVG
jgi:hypothetical protein